MVRHRKHLDLDAVDKTAGQSNFQAPNERQRAPGASNERHSRTSVRHGQSGVAWLPATPTPSSKFIDALQKRLHEALTRFGTALELGTTNGVDIVKKHGQP
ncbi:hypothetical protein HEK131_43460 [Streptomyces seoulensis]|nr:hypothetical protein HEK131_43460 [Streptomyces seoulensis]